MIKRNKPLKRSGIKRTLSKKREIQVRLYNNKTKPEYLIAHSQCEVEDCHQRATQIHHKKGKIGDLLNDTEYFLAVCWLDHDHIERHPIWAKEKGYSLNRLS